jgi:hypothetical protein
MLRINFSLKAFYAIAIAAGLSILYAAAGFMALEGMAEEVLENVLVPAWTFGFGTIIVFVEYWWRVKDPEATLTIWGARIKWYGIVLMGIGLYLFWDFAKNGEMLAELKQAGLFTAIATVVLFGLYTAKKKLN